MLDLLKSKPKDDKRKSSQLLADEIADLEVQIAQKDSECKTAQRQAWDLDDKKNMYRAGRAPKELLVKIAEFQEASKFASAEKLRLEREKSAKKKTYIEACKSEKEALMISQAEGLDEKVEEIRKRRSLPHYSPRMIG